MTQESLREAEHLLVLLAREMREGRGDLERADTLRDELDMPLKALSSGEQTLINALSADLFLLEGDRRIEPLAEGGRIEEVLGGLPTAFRAADSIKTLMLLRRVPGGQQAWPDDKLAYAFGRCWEHLGFAEAAAAFYDFAYEREPRLSYALMAFDALMRAGHHDEVQRRIAALEADVQTPPALSMRAAALLFQLTSRRPTEERLANYRRIVALADRGGADETVLGSVRSAGFTAAAFAHEHLNDPRSAMEAFDKAVAARRSDASLVARGLAKARADRAGALADFRAALTLGTSLVWPYLYVAHDAIEHSNWGEAQALSLTGAEHATTAPLRARLLEWAAIASTNVGDAEAAATLFEAALAYDPFDPVIRANAAKFAEARAGRDDWEVVAGLEIEIARRDFERQLAAAA